MVSDAKTAQISDEQLLARSRNGDKRAFAELVHRYEHELYNFLVRFLGQPSLAEDVFQETFLQVHISAADFDINRRFKPWLYTIAANKARDLLRSRSRRPSVQLSGLDDEKAESDLWQNLLRDDTTPDDVLEKKIEEEMVRQAVEALPDHLREILVLAYFKHFSYKEMAEILGIPLGTVKSRLHAAVGAFARKYQNGTAGKWNEEDGKGKEIDK